MASISRIETLDELEALLERSNKAPVWLLKHSLTCPISTAAWSEYQRFVEAEGDAAGAEFALVEIQNARPVSAAVAQRVAVRHESPQALLLSQGRAVWTGSHWDVTADALAGAQRGALESSTLE